MAALMNGEFGTMPAKELRVALSNTAAEIEAMSAALFVEKTDSGAWTGSTYQLPAAGPSSSKSWSRISRCCASAKLGDQTMTTDRHSVSGHCLPRAPEGLGGAKPGSIRAGPNFGASSPFSTKIRL